MLGWSTGILHQNIVLNWRYKIDRPCRFSGYFVYHFWETDAGQWVTAPMFSLKNPRCVNMFSNITQVTPESLSSSIISIANSWHWSFFNCSTTWPINCVKLSFLTSLYQTSDTALICVVIILHVRVLYSPILEYNNELWTLYVRTV